MSRHFKTNHRGPGPGYSQQECEDDKGLRKTRSVRSLLIVLLIADVVVTSKEFVLYGCVGGALFLVGIVVANNLIYSRKKAIKDKYLKP